MFSTVSTLVVRSTHHSIYRVPAALCQGWSCQHKRPTTHFCQVTKLRICRAVDCVWNVMAHAQKPDLVFRRNGWVHLNRRGASVQSTTGSRGVRISGSNAGYTMFQGSVRVMATHSIRQFPLHFPSRASPCAITFQLDCTSTPTSALMLCCLNEHKHKVTFTVTCFC
jgi:hypothetical protein